uniref:Uncharacterized protein n=1 Tax=Manihot esculenta TaxID=3983 RepID=A0A2C9WB32_MANES
MLLFLFLPLSVEPMITERGALDGGSCQTPRLFLDKERESQISQGILFEFLHAFISECDSLL